MSIFQRIGAFFRVLAIQKMKAAVDAHYAQQTFQKFPMMVYHHPTSSPARMELQADPRGREQWTHVPAKIVSQVVYNEDQLRDLIHRGWSTVPPKQ